MTKEGFIFFAVIYLAAIGAYFIVSRIIKYLKNFHYNPHFKWFDIWVGVYIDTKSKAVYIMPLPMVGIKVTRKVAK
jgi:hypothetical protein